MTCGIYLILCDERPYIGQSINIESRWKAHLRLLRRGVHSNSAMQNIWNEHGLHMFKFSIIEECEVNELTDLEQYWCDTYDSYRIGCNMSPYVDNPIRGRHHTLVAKMKISALRKDKPDIKRQFSEDQILKIWDRYMNGQSCLSIAADYGASDKIIWNIVNRKYYREIELPASCRMKEHRRKGGGRKKHDSGKSTELFKAAGVPVQTGEN